MSKNDKSRDDAVGLALLDLIDATSELDECSLVFQARPEEEWPTMEEEWRRYGELSSRVRKLAYRFVRFDTAATLAKFAEGATSIFAATVHPLITAATALGECMALADAKLTQGQDPEKILDGIVKLERYLCVCASDLSSVDAALNPAEPTKTPSDSADGGVRKALTDLQASKGKKKAQAVLRRYAPTGTLGSLKAEDRSKVLADVKRLLTLRLVK
jgi:hypothetical protein